MSVRLEPDRVADYANRRPFAYVVSTASDNGGIRAHVIAVVVTIDGERLDCSRVGGTTRRNIATNRNVTVVWPPISGPEKYDDYTLIADGQAHIEDDLVIVVIEAAILHRPATD